MLRTLPDPVPREGVPGVVRVRRRRGIPSWSAVLLVAAVPGSVACQGVPRALAILDRDNARAWVAPLTHALAPALTAGFFTSGGRGEGFHLALRLTAGHVDPADERFDPVLPGSVVFDGVTYADPYVVQGGTPSDGGRAPSVAGGRTDARLAPRPGSPFEAALDAAGVPAASRALGLPDGLGLSWAPLPVVEASLALRGIGLQFVGRFTPTVELFDEIGDASAFGAGVLVTVSRFLGVTLVDIGVSALTQKVHGGDWLDGSASALGVVVSRDFGPLRAYAHGTLASSSVDVRYRVRNPEGLPLLPPDGTPVAFRDALDGQARLALGTAVDLHALSLAAEYQPGVRDVLSVRATLFRRR